MGINVVPGGEYPIAKFNKRGDIVCPTCGFVTPVPDGDPVNPGGYYVGRGIGTCPNTSIPIHKFFITDDVSYAVNDIISKRDKSGENRRILKNFEETPKDVKPQQEGGKIIIP